jgi:hypothetical protein
MDTASIVGIVIACAAGLLIIGLIGSWLYYRKHKNETFEDADADNTFTKISKRAKRSIKSVGGSVSRAGQKTKELYGGIKQAVSKRWNNLSNRASKASKASTFSIEDLHYI